MTNSTTATLMNTSRAFVRALSRMPTTSTTVTSTMMMTAGRLNHGCKAEPSISENGSIDSCACTRGRWIAWRNSFK